VHIPTTDPDFDAIRCLSVPLAEKLNAYADCSAENYPDFKLLYDLLIERLAASGSTEGALRAGASFPPFVLPDTDGRLINSKKFLETGSLVISFNRGHWCPYCRLELLALEEIYAEVKGLGSTIISITPQRIPAASQLKEMCELTFPILCDIDNAFALECGLMMSIGPTVDQAYQDFGIDLASDQGNDGLFLPMPATYVVGRDGMIISDYLHPDFRTRMAPNDILKSLTQLSSKPTGGDIL